jgi:AcrR family transcriptional regulator
LATAARRLREYGLEGLNITGVADEAGISHATLIHHFGSSEGMRDALAEQMTAELIRDMLAALAEKVPPAELMRNLFRTLNEGGHAKLIAWRAVEGNRSAAEFSEVGPLVEDLLRQSAANLATEDATEVKNVIFLVASAALGSAVVGPALPKLLGMGEDEVAEFPLWLAARLANQSSP